VTEFLTFTLYAPLASWGDEAVGEVRGSWDRPSRSAILGLAAAALGLTREAEDDHRALDEMLGVAVRVASSGRAFVDYHTAMDPTDVAVRRFKPRTRKMALECAEADTTLTQRTLREDSLYFVALWTRGEARWSLTDLVRAFHSPVFVLYAGRKANVLGLPLGAAVSDHATIAAAVEAMPTFPPEMRRIMPREGWGREVSFDVPGVVPSGFETGALRSQRRRDGVPHRIRWQFEQREVRVGYLPQEAQHE
jgi:CRISPR system Cascade subunit CasD